MTRTDGTLYDALVDALKTTKGPVTAPDLYDIPKIKRLAGNVNRVSDYLGNLWRKGNDNGRDGQVLRYPAPRDANSASRWAYAWKPYKRKPGYGEPVEPPQVHRLSMVEVIEGTNDVLVNLPNMQIIIRPKQ